MRAERRDGLGRPLQGLWSSIMTTEHLAGVPEHGQQGACSVSQLSPLPAGYGVRIEPCLGRRIQGLWD